MPQFPYQPKSADPAAETSSDTAIPIAKVKPIEERPVEKKAKPPIKFKSVEPKGPVTRVRIDGNGNEPKTESKSSPFRDSGLLEDVDSIVKFRDDFGKPFVITVLALAIVGAIYWFSRPADKAGEAEKTISSLLVQADDLESQNPESLQQNFDLFDLRIDVADQLLAFDDQSIALDRGAELKLKTLVSWDTLNLENNIQDPTVTNKLETAAREFINSRNRTVANNAKVGLSLIRIRGYLDNPQPESFPEILDQFKLVSSFAEGDLGSAQNLLKIAKHFRGNGLTNESNQLFRAVNLACSASHNSEVAAIGSDAGQYLKSSSSLLKELKGLVATKGEVALQPIRQKIAENTTEESITTAKLESILEFLNFLVEHRAVPAVRVLLTDFSKGIYLVEAGIERDAIKKKYEDLSKRVDLVGKAFNFSGLYSVEGRPTSRGSLNSSNKILVFWSPENQKSVKLIKQMSEKHKLFSARRIQVVAVANMDDKNKRQVVELSNNTRGIEFLTLQKENSDSQAFINRTPIPKLPYWILLDKQDRVYAINIAINDLEED